MRVYVRKPFEPKGEIKDIPMEGYPLKELTDILEAELFEVVRRWSEIASKLPSMDNVVCLVDESGKYKNKPINFPIYGGRDYIVGTAVFVGTKLTVEGEEFIDLTDKQIEYLDYNSHWR